MKPKYTTQQKIGLFDRVKVFPRRGLYFIKLKLRYLLDKCRGDRVKENICSLELIDKWKQQLLKLQPVLDLFRLEIDSDKILPRSEAVLQHRFSLLGKLFQDIDWHIDPGSGYKWSKEVWYKHARKNLPAGVDIKLPWELSRCQHFIILGEAYRLTGDERYAIEYRSQILNWIENNPVRYGPNWTCTMDVGIRIANWMVSLLYFFKSPVIDEKFLSTLLESAHEHGRHIMNNLENLRAFTSNHYMGDISGLYMLAVLCPVLKLSEKWKNFAKGEIEREIFKQTFEDGWDFESSTAYHRLVTEMFLYPYLLADFLGESFSDQYAARLKKMLQVLGECAKPNGEIPQIGDNDSGRFLVFGVDREYGDLNINYLLETATRSFRIKPEIHRTQSIAYPFAGRYFLKSDRLYLAVSAGPKGQAGCGGHAHNDVLSFELNVDGNDIIVDPGTGNYTSDPDMRNCFRSVTRHNTLYWEGIEPCKLGNGLFLLPEEGMIKVEACQMGQSQEFFAAIYEYNGRYHRRQIIFDRIKEKIEVKDFCSHDGARLSFFCAPGINPVLEDDGFRSGEVSFHFKGAKSIKIQSSQYSPAYGELLSNKMVVIQLLGKECAWSISLVRGI